MDIAVYVVKHLSRQQSFNINVKANMCYVEAIHAVNAVLYGIQVSKLSYHEQTNPQTIPVAAHARLR